jgi:hypothetical protein
MGAVLKPYNVNGNDRGRALDLVSEVSCGSGYLCVDVRIATGLALIAADSPLRLALCDGEVIVGLSTRAC